MSPPSVAPAGMPWVVARSLGDYGERLAARYLQDIGLRVLDRNWSCELGEIDLVAHDGTCLVVCEVKTRRGSSFGLPIEAVTYGKLARLRKLGAAWLAAEHGRHRSRLPRTDVVRVDVVGVLLPHVGAPIVQHVPGVLP